MNKEQIVEAIRLATGGAFIGYGGYTTCMGWSPNYDSQGRLLNCDPNYRDSNIRIEGKDYHMTRVGWHVYIWNQPCSYCTVWKEDRDKYILAEVDLTPDYVKEYYANMKKEEAV
jgi:hypothetical protein